MVKINNKMAELCNKNLLETIGFKDVNILDILFQMHEGILIADKNGTILYYNQTQSEIDEVEIDYAIGKKITDIYNLSEEESTTMKCIKKGEPIRNYVIIYQTRSGKVANTVSNVFPIRKKEEIIGAVCFTKDYQMLDDIVSGGTQEKKSKTTKDNGTRFTFKDLVGNNHKLINAINISKLAADSPSPIMISGETGTGKELFAQSIHNCRSFGKEKFIPINCSAIPENLLEGILFGTSRGAFTGSIDKPGLFEQADGGTIFLDELDSMPLSLQAKVLRVVQEKKVRRLGSLKEVNLDIKIISTVTKDPDTIIRNGSLRLDLFYRMGVVFILIPTLRERLDDLELLVTHFINKFNCSLGKQIKGISERVRNIFYDYMWPGNVRELEHVIEGSMNIVNNDEDKIRIKHLPCHVLALLKASKYTPYSDYFSEYRNNRKECSDINILQDKGNILTQSSKKHLLSNKPTLQESQSANEKESICNALQSTNGNAAKAARILGLSPQSFHYKIKKYSIDKSRFADESRHN